MYNGLQAFTFTRLTVSGQLHRAKRLLKLLVGLCSICCVEIPFIVIRNCSLKFQGESMIEDYW